MVLSSDKLSGLRRPLLRLKFDIVEPNGKKREEIIEMEADKVKAFIENLKLAQKVGNFSFRMISHFLAENAQPVPVTA